jgi:hypothetical protein
MRSVRAFSSDRRACAAGYYFYDATDLEEYFFGSPVRSRVPAFCRYKRFIYGVVLPPNSWLSCSPPSVILLALSPPPPPLQPPPVLSTPILALTVTLAHIVCAASTQSAPDCAGSKAPAADFQLGTVSVMHIEAARCIEAQPD